jgi:predicted nucleic acid-binding protein
MDENLKGYLLDTNILIYHLKGDIPQREIEKIESILKHSFIISVITKIEFLVTSQIWNCKIRKLFRAY